jgi:hypothetical protein
MDPSEKNFEALTDNDMLHQRGLERGKTATIRNFGINLKPIDFELYEQLGQGYDFN